MIEIREKYSESSEPPREFTIKLYYGTMKKGEVPDYSLITRYRNSIHTEIYDYRIWNILKDEKPISLDNQ
jgi:hypothetical protein